jgi:uncharacterized membrane protein
MVEAIFQESVHVVSFAFGVVGAVLIVYGGIFATIKLFQHEIMKNRAITYDLMRRDFTGKIVFGLEFFIAADILTTLIAPTADELLLLGAVVLIRTILGYFLSRESKEFSLDT